MPYAPNTQAQYVVGSASNPSSAADNAIAKLDAAVRQVKALSIGGTGDFAATADQLRGIVWNCSGALTGDRQIVVPVNPDSTVPHFAVLVVNGTSGAFDLTVGYAAGSVATVPQGASLWVYGNGTNVALQSSAAPAPVALTMTGDTTATSDHVAASLLVLRGSPASGSLLTLPNITFSIFIVNETGVDIDVTRATSGTTDTLPDGYMRNYYHVP